MRQEYQMNKPYRLLRLYGRTRERHRCRRWDDEAEYIF